MLPSPWNQLRLWVWLLWAAALLASILATRTQAQPLGLSPSNTSKTYAADLSISNTGPSQDSTASHRSPGRSAKKTSPSLATRLTIPTPPATPGTQSLRPTRETSQVQAIATRIRHLQPHAVSVVPTAQAIIKAAAVHGVDPLVLVAIAMQETSFHPRHRWYTADHADLGMYQINSRTARDFACKTSLLLTYDPGESARCAALILRAKMRQCQALGLSVPDSVGCYHSVTPRFRDRYLRDLRRWL